MAYPAGELVSFAYGEDLEGLPPRSLGYRLLAPLAPEPWCAEVEALARRLQAAPYSDHWPPADLFCSVVLADGRRLVALARYGLADHTPSHRRGGLELVGVVAPAGLDVRAALSLYSWLQRRRDAAEDLHQLGGVFQLADVLATAAPPPPAGDPLPVLPVRLWQEGALLFAASTPADPDHRLRLLEQGAGASWQWLPLVGPDFPFQTYSQRGPLVAWTAHFAGVALKVDRRMHEAVPHRSAPMPRALKVLAGSLVVALAGLLVGNLWSLQDLRKRMEASWVRTERAAGETATPAQGDKKSGSDEAGRDRFVEGLKGLIDPGGPEWRGGREVLLSRYQDLVRTHRDLRVRDSDEEAKLSVAAISLLSKRSANYIENEVRQALAGKGFSDLLIDAACQHVRKQFSTAAKGVP
jgi:hypothetical protein